MKAIYNGVPFNVTRLVAHEAEAVYDQTDTDYLWTRHVVTLEATVGRLADAYTFGFFAIPNPPPPQALPLGPVPIPQSNLGVEPLAIESVASIRHALAQPRKPFALWEDATVAGSEPYPLLYCDGLDANNGPRMLEPASVQSIHGGGRLAFVRMTIELCINECPTPQFADISNRPGLQLLSLDGRPVLLSNRYTVGVGYDDESEAITYTYAGRATFRSDALAKLGVASPDQFRGDLLPRMFYDCKRFIKQMDLSPDGLSIDYTVLDVQQIRNYVDWQAEYDGRVSPLKPGDRHYRNVESVDVVVERSFEQPSVSKGIFRVVDNLAQADWAVNSIQAATPWGTFAKATIASLRTIDDLLPIYRESASARVQINREGRMYDAQALAFALVSGALDIGTLDGANELLRQPRQAARLGALPPASEFTVRYNPMQGWVEVSLRQEQSGLLDFVISGQQQGQQMLLNPIKDHVLGGRLPISIFSVMDLLGIANVNTLIGIGIADAWKLFKSKLDTMRYSDQLLISDAHFQLRGPSGDSRSRAAFDALIRSAQLLLRPCETPLPPVNQFADVRPTPTPGDFVSGVRIRSGIGTEPPPSPPPPPKSPGDRDLIGRPPASPSSRTVTPFTAARASRKTVQQLVAEWQRELG